MEELMILKKKKHEMNIEMFYQIKKVIKKIKKVCKNKTKKYDFIKIF